MKCELRGVQELTQSKEHAGNGSYTLFFRRGGLFQGSLSGQTTSGVVTYSRPRWDACDLSETHKCQLN